MIFLKRRKDRLRKTMGARRKTLAEAHPDAAEALCRNFPEEIWPKIGATVSAYVPIAGEIDPLKLLGTFACEGATTCLPVAKKDGVMEFRVWKPGDPLRKVDFGLQEPEESADIAHPDIVLTPLLAFDLKGRRLGWGGGFYDREVAAMRADRKVAIVGIAFDAQKVPRVPTGKWDQPLDWIVTEAGAYKAEH